MNVELDESVLRLLLTKSVIFWDFDGVIKDSVDVKTRAYEALFLPYGSEVATRVREHHESHCGVSRFDKIPLYLKWAGLAQHQSQIDLFCERFSDLTLKNVVDSPWVPGVHKYLLKNFEHQYFVLLTATPQEEIETVIKRLNIAHCFKEVYGAPNKKTTAMANVMQRDDHARGTALMIGDAEADLEAAQKNNIPFLLRRTSINHTIQKTYDGPQFEDLES